MSRRDGIYTNYMRMKPKHKHFDHLLLVKKDLAKKTRLFIKIFGLLYFAHGKFYHWKIFKNTEDCFKIQTSWWRLIFGSSFCSLIDQFSSYNNRVNVKHLQHYFIVYDTILRQFVYAFEWIHCTSLATKIVKEIAPCILAITKYNLRSHPISVILWVWSSTLISLKIILDMPLEHLYINTICNVYFTDFGTVW